MAKALPLTVKEPRQHLQQSLLKKQPPSLRSRIVMLLSIKKHQIPLSKIELARLVGVNANSIQSWRIIYLKQGLDGLLRHRRGGKCREVVTARTHKAIEKRLRSSDQAFASFKELQHWVEEHYIKDIKYVTINAYVKRHFGAKLKKIARKSHINKSEQAIADFFKKLRYSSKNSHQKIEVIIHPATFISRRKPFGLFTRNGRAHTTKGVQPICPYQHRFENLYLFGAFSAITDDSLLLEMPFCTTEMFRFF